METFFSSFLLVFAGEMGDKTQLATIALGAHYSNTTLVTFGTTLGMVASNALAIFLGHKLLARIPMKWIRVGASLLFLAFGAVIAITASRQLR
ncbi:MAG: TMEM165/GDT1 family protein [Bacteriovoracia bacterium]